MALSPTELQALRQLYRFRCGYCGVSETEAGAQLTVDHFQPRSAQGADSLENSVYCCPACNTFKGAYWNPGGVRRILHPIHDLEETHLEALPDGTMRGLTETGEFHLQRLHLNRPALVAHRLDFLERQQERERTARIETELEQVRQQRDALLQRVPRE
nr:HNH endonuclease signature motif containing protein [Armatimonas sp.]